MPRFQNKKIVACVLVSIFVVSSFGFSPQKTHGAGAAGFVTIVGELPTGDIPLDFRELADGILWLMVNSFIRATTASIVDWINSGFQGDPFFLTNPGDHFEDLLLETTGVFMYELGLENSPLCTGFREPVIRALVPQPYRISAQCTIEDVVGNVEDFTAGNWEEGGWAGWIQLTQHPQNNPYGAYLLADEELRRRQLENQEQQRQELLQGGGFLSFKRCVARAPASGTGNPHLGEEALTGEGPCIRYETDTPGHTIAEQLDISLGEGPRRRALADEFNEAIANIVDALVNQFMLTGLRALSGDDERGVEPYYTEQVENDKETLLEEIGKEIDIEEARIDANTELSEGLAIISETKACYETQKSFLRDPNFNPPAGATPTLEGINERIGVLDEKRSRFISAAGSSSIPEAEEDLETLEEMRTRAENAETPRDIADVWNDFNEYKQNKLGEEQADGELEDRQTLSQLNEEKENLRQEKAQCEEDMDFWGGFVGRPTPVKCVEGCIPEEGGGEESGGESGGGGGSEGGGQ